VVRVRSLVMDLIGCVVMSLLMLATRSPVRFSWMVNGYSTNNKTHISENLKHRISAKGWGIHKHYIYSFM
jgi:hypothetical protein